MIHDIKKSSVSFFAHNTDVLSPYNGNIVDILTSKKLIEKHGKRIEQLRASEYKSAEYNDLKNGIKGRVNSLPLITPHGTFTQRGSNYLIKHSGLLSFDIDCGGNSWLNKDSAPLLRDKLGAINSVCYCALSAGGQGVWGVVAIQHTDKHEQYYLQMERDFLQRFKIVIDKSCKDIPRARYWSHDQHAVIKAIAEYYKPTFYTPPPTIPKPARQYTNNGTIPEAAAKYLIDNKPSLECTYRFFICIFFACRDAFGEAGKQTAIDILTACTTFAASNTAKNVDAVWRSTAGRPTGKAITAGTLIHIAQEAGYRVPTKQTKPAQQTTTPSRHSFVMPAPNYGTLDKVIPVQTLDEVIPVQALDEVIPVQALDEVVPVQTLDEVILVQTLDEAVPVQALDEVIPVQTLDEVVPVQTLDDTVNQALQAAGWIHHYTETEAEQNDWNNLPGVRWAKQIRQRGTSKNAVPYWERQTARQ